MKRLALVLLLASSLSSAQLQKISVPGGIRMWPSPALGRIPYVCDGTTGSFCTSASFAYDGADLYVAGRVGIGAAAVTGTKLYLSGSGTNANIRFYAPDGDAVAFQFGGTNGYAVGRSPAGLFTVNRDVPFGTFNRHLFLIDGSDSSITSAELRSTSNSTLFISGTAGGYQTLQFGATNGYAIGKDSSDVLFLNRDAPIGTQALRIFSADSAGSFGLGTIVFVYRTTNGGSNVASRFYVAATTGADRFTIDNDESSSTASGTRLGFNVSNTSGNVVRYAAISCAATSRTAGSEAGYCSILAQSGGSAASEIGRFDGTGLKLPGLTANRPVVTDGNSYLTTGTAIGGVAADPALIHNRLTLTSGTPVTSADVTAATTVYSTPYKGGQIALYYSSTWTVYSNAEKSINLTDTQTCSTTNTSTSVTGCTSTTQLARGMAVSGTGIPGGATVSAITSSTAFTLSAAATATGSPSLTFKVPASTPFDVFAVATSTSAWRLQLHLWSSGTARAVGVTYANAQDGVLMNDTVISSGDDNSIAAKTGRYLGTGCTTSTAGQIEDSATKRLLWNYYERERRIMLRTESTASWTYTTANTFRQARASTSNQLEVVVGQAEEVIDLFLSTRGTHTANPASCILGIGRDSRTTTLTGTLSTYSVYWSNTIHAIATVSDLPAIGYHYYAWLEGSPEAGTQTYYSAGTAGGITVLGGMKGTWRS